MLKIDAFGITHEGCSRAANEDALAWEVDGDTGQAMAVIADGMGGYAGGEIASRMAIETVTEALMPVMDQPHVSPETARAALENAVYEANSRIQDARGSHPNWSRMGTTLVAVHISGGVACLAHIGDSRCYLFSQGHLEAKTRDDSVVQAMLDVGEITEADVPRVPFRNVLTKALGVEPEVSATYSELPVAAGDTLILCSDGVIAALPPARWPELMAAEATPESQARALIDACLKNQAEDNVSLVLIRIR